MTLKNLLLAGALIAGLASTTPTADAGDNPYLGEGFIMPYSFCPRGTVSAEGQLLAISQNQALYSLYGTTYGGDGRTTFAMPDMRGRVPLGMGNGPGLTPRTMGQRGGAETNIIQIVNMPAHNHRAGIQTYTDPANSTDPQGNAFGIAADNHYVTNETAPSGKFMNPLSVRMDNTGANQAVNGLQPFLALRYCVATQGVFPSRN